jgi:ribosomal protein S18 acetylase RimI-like enzyme
MLLNDIEYKLKFNHLEVKDNNYDDIFNLYKNNEEFAKISANYPVTMDCVIEDIKAIPPSVDSSNKHYLSIYDNKELVGVLDIINNFSYQDKNNNDAIWLGLLEIDVKKHNKGLGSLIISILFEVFKENNKSIIQLGVIKENTNALNFWKKVGFKVFKETNNGESDLYLMEKEI